MKLRDLYNKAIATGTENDPRGKDSVVADLEARGKSYASMKDDEREFFDTETLQNPYSDSRILNGIEVNKDTLAYDVINSAGIGGNFLASHHTASNFKNSSMASCFIISYGWLRGFRIFAASSLSQVSVHAYTTPKCPSPILSLIL